ncbi:MAG: hydrolase 1, exosortase A system-associated [Halioglobus sp.]|nr:hydrolase 1, exosortase A system-associated [Halioglobus sp.]
MTDIEWEERGIVFECGENRLVGIAALPQRHTGTGVMILVGGPQYRAGSHRQFTLLARDMAGAGVPSLRFDFTGMGDSEGERRDFSATDADIDAALEAFHTAQPGLERVVLWGLCDAASAAMMFAHRHARIVGLVLLNPWVHGAEYSPQVKLSHYYRPYLTARGNWRRLFSGKIDLVPAAREFAGSSVRMVADWLGIARGGVSRHTYVQDMLDGFARFTHDSLIILSENDLTAREFSSLAASDKSWDGALTAPGVTMHTVADADHTFSRRAWQDEVSRLTIDWIRQR